MTDNLIPKDYKLEWIAVRNLSVVWPEAQRKINEARVKKIADNFDPDLLDPIKVTLPNGNGIYHVCDGQKRARAVELALGADQKMPCLVANVEGPARAAEIFLDTNSKSNRQDVNALENFLVAITAQRPDEVAINKIVRHCGYRVEGSHAQNTIGAVEALRVIYHKGPSTLDRTLRTLRDTWGGDPAGVNSTLIKGYGTFICEFSEGINWDRLRDCVKNSKYNTPGKMLNEAQGIREHLHTNMTKATTVFLLQTYNKGLPVGKKLRRKGEDT
jgi:hypothetical protein